MLFRAQLVVAVAVGLVLSVGGGVARATSTSLEAPIVG